MSLEARIPSPPGFPLFGWTEDKIKQFIGEGPLQVGDPMIIYNGQGGMHRYTLSKVENSSLGRQKRVLLSKVGESGGCTFYRSGKNCFAPTGQTRMLPPIPELMTYLSETTDIWLV